MVTLHIGILLATGFAAAKICQRCHLPSVTGYILAGLLLGPGALGLITPETLGGSLDHFTQIALMLIAFGVGEHLELRKLHTQASGVLWIAVGEALGAFVLVAALVYLVVPLTGLQVAGWQRADYLVLAILLGAVAASGSPAVTLMVSRELKASGPLTATLLAVVAIDSGVALMIIALAVTLVHSVLEKGGQSLLLVAGNGLLEIAQSLILGVVAGLGLDSVAKRLKNTGEILIAGLALLLMCSEGARLLELSPLLAGMAAGFTLVNRSERDVRVFRVINSFEPPVYVLFFTLVGTRFDPHVLVTAGGLGLLYFLARVVGKGLGAAAGGRRGGADPVARRFMGLALVPQAGVAIGLIYSLSGDPALAEYNGLVAPIGLTGVFVSQLVGAYCVRLALTRAGESHLPVPVALPEVCNGLTARACELHLRSASGVRIPPWEGNKLIPVEPRQGTVVFGVASGLIAPGLARFATILAHSLRAIPLAVRVQHPGDATHDQLFEEERREVARMGYDLVTEVVPDASLASGLVAAVEYNMAHAVLLGSPLAGESSSFRDVLETVTTHVCCPVMVVRFCGDLCLRRILVPVADMDELEIVAPLVLALGSVGEHQIELLFLMPSGEPAARMAARKEQMRLWLASSCPAVDAAVKVVATDARVETIVAESQDADLVIMGASRNRGLKKFVFGSLAAAVAPALHKTLIVVYRPDGAIRSDAGVLPSKKESLRGM